MKRKNKSFLAEAGNVALMTLVIIWVLNFLLTRRLGGFIILTLIAGFGSFLVVCGAINAVAFNLFDCYSLEPENWWPIQVLCWGGGALFSALFMSKSGMWESVDTKCRKIDREVDRIH